jgi:hypothetical protein
MEEKINTKQLQGDIEGLLQETLFPRPSISELCNRLRRVHPEHLKLKALRYSDGDTLLHYWARYPYSFGDKEAEFFELLMKTDLSECVNLPNDNGEVSLFYAVKQGLDRTRLLLYYSGTNSNFTFSLSKTTVLYYVSIPGCIHLLLSKMNVETINQMNSAGITAFLWTTMMSDHRCQQVAEFCEAPHLVDLTTPVSSDVMNTQYATPLYHARYIRNCSTCPY